jgi:HSP20 family molecular chaperone IbpA
LISPANAASRLPDGPKFMPRTDIHYSTEACVLTAMLELPGMNRSDISLVLSTSAFNRVKQVVVTGRSKPEFTEDVYALRERKFGLFSRTFVVPNETRVSLSFTSTIATVKNILF